jgi:hypothetical protein
MARQLRRPFWSVVPVLLLAVFIWNFFSAETTVAATAGETSGALRILGKDGSVHGACPLKHTEVRGAISGFLARVEVTQGFEVPVEMSDGVTYEGVFGSYKAWLNVPNAGLTMYSQLGKAQTTTSRVNRNVAGGIGAGSGAGFGAGVGCGTGGGMFRSQAPAPPPASQAMVITDAGVGASSVAEDEKPTGERVLLESKLHPALLDAFDCWKKSRQDCQLVKDGTIEVQLWLTDDSSAVLEQLKALGFTTSETRPKEKAIVGHMPVEKLTDLTKIGAVRFVSPVRR